MILLNFFLSNIGYFFVTSRISKESLRHRWRYKQLYKRIYSHKMTFHTIHVKMSKATWQHVELYESEKFFARE